MNWCMWVSLISCSHPSRCSLIWLRVTCLDSKHLHINKATQSFDPITGLEISEAGAAVGSAGCRRSARRGHGKPGQRIGSRLSVSGSDGGQEMRESASFSLRVLSSLSLSALSLYLTDTHLRRNFGPLFAHTHL